MSAPRQEIDDDAKRGLEAEAARALGRALTLAPFAAVKGVADETLKLAARGADGAPLGVLLCSPAVAPGLIARGCARGRAARERLGAALGAPVLVARAEGIWLGRSWALFPQARSLGGGLWGRAERRWLAGALLGWLRAVAAHSAGPADEAAAARTAEALAYAEREPALDTRVREAARAAAARIASGAWRPRHVLMHGDLWAGNVLGAPGSRPFSRRFAVIDWDTSRLEGHALFDLVRAARSFGLSRTRLAREIAAHAALLGCAREDARGALVAALGHVGRARESFPLERYAEMSRAVLAAFDAAS